MANEPDAKPAGPDRLTEALSTIADVVLGRELESVRGSVLHLGTELSERLQGEIGSLQSGMSRRVDELARKLDEAEDRQCAALEKLDKLLTETCADLGRRIEAVQQRADAGVETARTDLADDLAARAEALQEEIASLSRELTAVQLGLEQQQQAAERVSGLLGNVASAFTGAAVADAAWQNPDIPGVTVAEPDAEPAAEVKVNLDDTVDGIFTE